jgi:hypothetical protein
MAFICPLPHPTTNGHLELPQNFHISSLISFLGIILADAEFVINNAGTRPTSPSTDIILVHHLLLHRCIHAFSVTSFGQ